MRRTVVILLLGGLWSLTVFSPASAGDEAFRIGFGKAEITPDPQAFPITLNGYAGRGGAPAVGVLDPLYVRAMVVADPDGRLIAVVSYDLCYVHSEVRDAVVDRLAPLGFGEHNLLLAGTHTHAGPSAYDRRGIATLLMGDFDRRIFDQVVNGGVRAVTAARENMQPANLTYDTSALPGLNRSRRDPAFDVAEGGPGEGRQLTYDRCRYPTDERLTVLRAADRDGRTLGLLIRYSSHPTVLSPDNMKVSADWPGAMTAMLEKQLGRGAVAMFLNGSLGDAAPLPDWSNVPQEEKDAVVYGERLAEAVLARLDQLQPLRPTVVAGHTSRSRLPRPVARPLGRMPMKKAFTGAVALRTDPPFQAVRIGNLVLLAVPGEPTTLLGRELEGLCGPDLQCLTVAPANGYLSYFVTHEEYQEDKYAPNSCFFGEDTDEWVRRSLRSSVLVIQSGR